MYFSEVRADKKTRKEKQIPFFLQVQIYEFLFQNKYQF